MNARYFKQPALLLLLFAVGCQDLVENPKGSLTPVTYFKTQSDLDAALASAYVAFAIDGAYGFTSRMTSYFGADDLTTDPALNKADFRDFDRLSGGSGNGSLVAEWQGPWQAIYQANNVIANYKKVQSTDVLKNGSAGEGFFFLKRGGFKTGPQFCSVPPFFLSNHVSSPTDPADVANVFTATF